MKFLKVGFPQKPYYKTCKILSYPRFLCNCKYDIKLNIGSIPFSNRKCKRRKKIATKEKKKEKNTASANINSPEVLKIE